jgi:hypothetical protein
MSRPGLEIVLPGTCLPARVIWSGEERTLEPLQVGAAVKQLLLASAGPKCTCSSAAYLILLLLYLAPLHAGTGSGHISVHLLCESPIRYILSAPCWTFRLTCLRPLVHRALMA